MGKHYRDPKDKPTLLEQHYNDVDKYPSPYHTLKDVCEALLNAPADSEGAQRVLYAVLVPENPVRDKQAHCRYYLTYAGAKAWIEGHNSTRVTKQNEGNKRKAKLLVYSPDEMRTYLIQLAPQNNEGSNESS
jgi:hypothetical protein